MLYFPSNHTNSDWNGTSIIKYSYKHGSLVANTPEETSRPSELK